jgi:thiamine transport system ATP-binding protein
MVSMLDVGDVTVAFDGRPVLDRVSLAVDQGEIVALVGPSGSGKSTLLRVIAGLHVPDAGSVWCEGVLLDEVPAHRRRFGFVFQDEQLFPHRDVAGNVGFGLRLARVSREDLHRRVTELLALVHLPGFERRKVPDLSGGEAKRVALARALAPAPRLLLLDEPLTGLDGALHDQLAEDLRAVLTTTGTTAVLVTHDLTEARTIADRIVSIEDLSPGAPASDWSGLASASLRPLPPGSLRLAPRRSRSFEIVELATADTYDLRRRVLRDGTPTTDVTYAQDDRSGTFHLGVRLGGRLVGTSSWALERWPEEPERPAVRLRGMAVERAVQGTGAGAALVEAGLHRARSIPVTLVWATARDAVLGFYERCGFTVVGDGFVDAPTALPHHTVIRRL